MMRHLSSLVANSDKHWEICQSTHTSPAFKNEFRKIVTHLLEISFAAYKIS